MTDTPEKKPVTIVDPLFDLKFEGEGAWTLRFLQAPCLDDQFRVAMDGSKTLKDIKLTYCVGDFGIASHNVPCFVCWEQKAISMDGGFGPCRSCQQEGWAVVQVKRGLYRRLIRSVVDKFIGRREGEEFA